MAIWILHKELSADHFPFLPACNTPRQVSKKLVHRAVLLQTSKDHLGRFRIILYISNKMKPCVAVIISWY